MSDCSQVPLLEFLREDLDYRQSEGVMRHLEECRPCRERLRVMALLQAGACPVGASRLLPWGVAAGLLLAFLGWILFRGTLPPHPSEIAQLHPYPAFPLSVRSQSSSGQEWESALQAYREGRYEAALRHLSNLPEEGEILFYRGVCLLLLERRQEGLALLEKASAQASWRRPALWYRAQALLLEGSPQQARPLLEELAREEGSYHSQAARQLEKLRQWEQAPPRLP